MKFFFPDTNDYVDPTFDFELESNNEHRIIQRDDKYAHELFKRPIYDGILVSKAVVDGVSGVKGTYSVARRQRFFREGVKRFFRLPQYYETMGDCGAFSFAEEYEPPFKVEDVIEFYEVAGFTHGISLDHIVFGFEGVSNSYTVEQFEDFKRRKNLTLELADEFFKLSKNLGFTPYGVAHGWNPGSYADSVSVLQKIGYTRISMGGMVPLKTYEILSVLEKVNSIRNPTTQLHLLGVYRLGVIEQFSKFGVSSFDSTSPLMKGLKDEKYNYHTPDSDGYTSIGIPQVGGNLAMKRLVSSGKVDQNYALLLEQECLNNVIQYDKGLVEIGDVVNSLCEYEALHSPKVSRRSIFEEVLFDKPWKLCQCDICQKIGIHVILKRGAQRNRRRGFHNLYVAYQKLQHELMNSNER
jgi:hypothetical protein